MSKYKITVITPVYKVEKYVEKCCRSLFGQPIKDVEFVFVDDNSPDKSVDIINNVLAEYPHRKEHVKIIRHQINCGVAYARNTGLENATGEYIMYVDADDWLEPGAMQCIYEIIDAGGYDIVGYDWFLEFETNRRYLRQPSYNKVWECLNAMLAGELRWYLWAFVVRRSLYVENGFRFIPGLNVGEDMMMLLKLFASANSYSHIPNALYHYIQLNKASITQLEAKKQLAIVKQNADEVISFLRDKYGKNMELNLHFLMLKEM